MYRTNEELAGNKAKPPMEVIKVKQSLMEDAARELNTPVKDLNGKWVQVPHLCSRDVKLFNFKSQVGFMLEPMFSTQH